MTPTMKVADIKNGICAVISENDQSSLVDQIKSASNAGADLVELRIDFLKSDYNLKTILESCQIPCLVTIRRKKDGGEWTGPEDHRIGLLQQACDLGAAAVDIEEDVFNKISKSGETIRLLSYHNFNETPGNLEDLFQRFRDFNPDMIKIACKSNSFQDWLNLFKLYKLNGPKKILFGMGTKGFPSRILSLQEGAPWMYATHSLNQPNAPGIPTLNKINKLYSLKTLSEKTKIYGVVGDPITQSISPDIHNTAFRHAKFDGIYLPFHVSKSEYKDFLDQLPNIRLEGLSVTIPHKEESAARSSTKSNMVERIGAANTLIHSQNGYHAENTDALAIVSALKHQLGNDLSNIPVLILGAGGAGRAGAYALKEEGCDVFVTNRSHERSEALAREMSLKIIPWEDRHQFSKGILLQCTSLGMHPNPNESAWNEKCFTPEHIAFDTVYNPLETKFLLDAKKASAKTIPGIEMFVHQAAAQFYFFTGLDAPLDIIRETALSALRDK